MNTKKAIFAVFFVAVIISSCESWLIRDAIEDGGQWVKDIDAAMKKVKEAIKNGEKGLLNKFDTEEICYPDLGCYRADGPMKQTGTFPLTPESMGTTFHTFTSDGKSFIVDAKNPKSFSGLDFSKRLVVISHGFGMSSSSAELNSIKDHLLMKSHDEVGAVIIVDWAKGAKSPEYLQASANTELVGRQIGNLLNSMKLNEGLKPENVYLIGFSLGAQVSGFAGKWTQSQYGWKVGRITGLDAAAPLFEGYPGSHLTKADASFVDGIHSSAGDNILAGKVGFVAPYGSVDFYPNGGASQPHCGFFSGVTCNHYGSVLFYDASLHAKEKCKFKGAVCDSWADYVAKQCPVYDAELGYFAEGIKKLGNGGDRQTFGSRFLATTKKTPFCG